MGRHRHRSPWSMEGDTRPCEHEWERTIEVMVFVDDVFVIVLRRDILEGLNQSIDVLLLRSDCEDAHDLVSLSELNLNFVFVDEETV